MTTVLYLLRKLEWSGVSMAGTYSEHSVCPECREPRDLWDPEEGYGPGKHKADCELAEHIRKIEQDQREFSLTFPDGSALTIVGYVSNFVPGA